MTTRDWRDWLVKATLAVISFALIVGVAIGSEYGTQNSWLFWAEHWTGDWRSAYLSDRPESQHPKVAIVKIDEDTIKHYPYRTPVDRGLLARLVTALDEAGAEAIAIDFLFLKDTELDKDEALVQAIKTAKTRVVVAAGDKRVNLSDIQREYQENFLKRSGAVPGYANLLTESDRIVRFIAPPADKAYLKSFAVAAARPDADTADGPRRIAWLLKPRDGSERFLELPAHLLAAPAGEPTPPAASALSVLLKGRVVLIGADLIGLDRHLTPLAQWEGDDEMAGVMLHAQVAAQLLDDRSVTRVAPGLMRFAYALLAAFGILAGLRHGTGGYSLYFGTVTLVIAVIDILLFVLTKQFIPFSACLAVMLVGLLCGIALRRVMRLLNALIKRIN